MKEWIITNGLGGYASSTYYNGMNTRRYHGLLIAPLDPPAKRTLILSKLDESIEIGEKKYNLFTNETNKVITKGYNYLIKFEKDIVPIFTYSINGVIVEKTIIMQHEKNAVIVMYKISNKNIKTKLNLTPIMNFRDFHSEKHDKNFNFSQNFENNLLKIDFNNGYKASIYVNDAKYNKATKGIFSDMHYSREKDRGFDADENHYIPGTFSITINKNEDKKICFICSLDGKYGFSDEEIKQIDGEKIIIAEKKRIDQQIKETKLVKNIKQCQLDLNANNKLDDEDEQIYKFIIRKYMIASDNFIVFRDSNKLHTIIAGYPWFLDWARDSFISFEGLLLISRKFEIAKEVLKTFSTNVKDGLVPNGFSEYDNKPLYNSVDASLLFIDAVNKYYNYTEDLDTVKELYGTMHDIIENYINGIDLDNNNIYLDETDYLLVSGTNETQNTWMDAKVNGKAVTPRNGKAVEINAMWFNALNIMKRYSEIFKKTLDHYEYSYLIKKFNKSFEKEFYNENKKCLYDVVDTDIGKKVTNKYDEEFHYGNDCNHLKDDKIRPNQLFAISMTYPAISPDSDIAKDIFLTCTEKLITKFGLRTLAKGEQGYCGVYQGNPAQRDSNYHQGITWPWLIGLYYDAFKNMINAQDYDEKNKELNEKNKETNEKNKDESLNKNFNEYYSEETIEEIKEQLIRFRIKIANVFINELVNGNTIGSISEVYDSDENASQGKGAFAQAWSVSEVFRVILGK